MLTNTSKFFQNHASGKNVIIYFVIVHIFLGALLFYTVPAVQQFSGEAKIFDLSSFGYTAEYAKDLLETLGVEGRQVYLSKHLLVDLFYPALFAIAYSLLLAYLFKKAFNPASKIHALSSIPAFVAIFDYLENLGVAIMLKTYPDFSPALASSASIATLLKTVFTVVTIILLVIAFVQLLIRVFKKQKPSQSI